MPRRASAGDDETRAWTEVTFADPARAAEWLSRHGVLAGQVQVLRAHRGQAAVRLYLTDGQRRALPGRAVSPSQAPDEPASSRRP